MNKLRIIAVTEVILAGVALFFLLLDQTGGLDGLSSQIRYDSWVRRYRNAQESFVTKISSEYDDYVGFLIVEGTSIEYPVMRDRDDFDGEYFYLSHNIDGEPDSAGCPFIRHSSDINDDIVEIFAHNNSNGTMFADLAKFEDEEFFEEYGGIILDTVRGKRSYRVIAVMDVDSCSDEFSFWGRHNFDDEESEEAFLNEINTLSRVSDNEEHVSGAQYLLLITCEYSHVNGRRIVVAVRTS